MSGGHRGGDQDDRRHNQPGGQVDAATRPIRARCAERVDALPIPLPFSMELLLRRLGDRRGKPIQLFATTLDPAAPCGVLVSTTTIDFVCYAADTSPLHRQHIILHEIGHLEFGHEGHRITVTGDQPAAGGVEQLMPHLDPSGIRRLLHRSNYHTTDEAEAELFATLAGDRINRLIETRHGAAPRDLTVVRLRTLFDIPAPRGHRDG